MENVTKQHRFMSFKEKQQMYAQALQNKQQFQDQPTPFILSQTIPTVSSRTMTICSKAPPLTSTQPSSNYSIPTQQKLLQSAINFPNSTNPFFKDEIPTRQYTEKNIKKGRLYFEQRYIQLKTNPKLQDDNKDIITPYDKYEQYEYDNSDEESDDDEEYYKKKKSTSPKTILIAKDNITRKYLLYYKEIIENSIILFNKKQYQESYETLLEHEVINSLTEYAEFLFLTNGYDKNILGDFLSKKHKPNENGEVLDTFMSCFYFNDLALLECFRFLFTRVSLPKDTNLALVLLDKWSTYCYNSKSHTYKNAYKDINAVYLLCSSILTVNTTNIRKDLKKVNALTLEDFVRINENVDKKESESIYKKLKRHPINNTPLFIDISYKRLAREVIQYDNTNANEDDSDFSLQTYFDLPNETNALTYEVISLLNGDVFEKVDKNGIYKDKQLVYFKDNFSQIIKSKNQSKLTPFKKVIDINDIKGVYIGTGNSNCYKEIYIPPDEEGNYITILLQNGKTIDLHHDKEDIITKWYVTIRMQIMKHKADTMRAKEKEINDKEQQDKEFIKQLWQNEILINWNYYRKYIIYKQQSIIKSSNDKKENEENGVVSLKTIKEKLNMKLNKEITGNNTDVIASTVKNIFTLNEIIFIFSKGIIDNLRGDIWSMLLKNPPMVTESLYNHYLSTLPNIDFTQINTLYNTNSLSPLLRHIIQAQNYFINELPSLSTSIISLMQSTYNIVSVFLLYRPDVNYSKNLVFFSLMFLLNNTSEYNSFINLVSFCTKSSIMPFLVNDTNLISRKIEFFNYVLKVKENKAYNRLRHLEVATEFYLVEWFESVFVQCFSYKVVKRIWDLFLLKGESELYKVAYGIMYVQREIIENGTVKGIVDRLRKMGNGYEEEKVMEVVGRDCGIGEMYNKWVYESELGEEKGILYKGY